MNAKTYKSDLDKQTEYAEKTDADKLVLIAPKSFVQGMRDSGYKSTATALDEFIDNAIQAEATRVDILIGYTAKNTTMKKLDREAGGLVAIVDDGHGMTQKMIRAAVRWGGTHRWNERDGMGRFGFGLPSAAVSISPSYEVYSKVAGGEWWMVRVDLESIGSDDASHGQVFVPEAVSVPPPAWIREAVGDLSHGTVILLDQPDRLTSGFVNVGTFKEKILHHVGLIYRNFFREVTMRLIDTGRKNVITEVEPIDPLFLTPGARGYNELPVPAIGLPEATFTVKTKDGLSTGSVRIRYAHFSKEFMGGRDTARMKVRIENMGFIMVRNGRQIEAVRQNPWSVLMNNDKFWGCEINFDAALDEDFGVTTNKQQINPTDRMWDILGKNGLENQIPALRKHYKDQHAKDAARKDAEAPKPSEQIAKKTEKFRKKRTVKPTPEKQRESEVRMKEEITKVQHETGKPADEIAAAIENSPYKVDFENLPGAPFFRLLLFGSQKRVLINSAHRFYTDLYSAPEIGQRTKTARELLLFVLGECELETTPDKERFYVGERNEWSLRLNIMLEELDHSDPVDDIREELEAEVTPSQPAM